MHSVSLDRSDRVLEYFSLGIASDCGSLDRGSLLRTIAWTGLLSLPIFPPRGRVTWPAARSRVIALTSREETVSPVTLH